VHKPSVYATNLLLRDFLVAKPYAATETDRGYPDNVHLEIENCIPVLKHLKRRPDPGGRAQQEQMMMRSLRIRSDATMVFGSNPYRRPNTA